LLAWMAARDYVFPNRRRIAEFGRQSHPKPNQ